MKPDYSPYVIRLAVVALISIAVAFLINEGAALYAGRSILAGPTNPLCLAAVKDLNGGGLDYSGQGDEDGDGSTDYFEACLAGSDPCDANSVPDPGPFSCGDCLSSNGTPGCENDDCEATVCAIDSWCCDVAWDGLCAAEANDICVPDICTVPSGFRPTNASFEGRELYPEPISKDPNYAPKE